MPHLGMPGSNKSNLIILQEDIYDQLKLWLVFVYPLQLVITQPGKEKSKLIGALL